MNDEKLTEVEELGRLQFSIDDICIILDIEEKNFNDKMLRAREKGRLMASSEVRKAILKQASNGSTPAQKQMMELIYNASFETEKDI
jgi:hypothetical protein